MEIIIKTFAGLEEVLAAELQALGAEDIQILKRAVSCHGNQQLLYRANLELRTALRVLIPITRFQARHEDDLYRAVHRIDWRKYMDVRQTLAIDVVTQSERLNHSHFLALKTKDAIADRFREDTGIRPSVDTLKPHLRIHVHIDGLDDCTISLDSSGDGLHRRAYRTGTGQAPINEVLAAGMVALSGWAGDTPFVDPFCGSGTILIEAAFVAGNIPPGNRRNFGFQQWIDYDRRLWEEVKEQARQRSRPIAVPILGGDRDPRALRTAEENIHAAGLAGKIKLQRANFDSLTPLPAPACLITNPPYDMRMPQEDVIGLYKSIGDTLKKNFQGYNAWIISAHIEALKHLGLRPARRFHLYNGPLPAKFHGYELYAGSRKIKEETS